MCTWHDNNIQSDSYDEKHLKIKLSSDDDSPLKKTIKLDNMVIAVRFAFHVGNKCYPQVSLNKCF